jgi:importin subunit alpha-1
MAERYIPEHRRTQFKAKNSFKPDELRRRREEQQVEIRRQKREENLAKRRGIQRENGQIGVGGLTADDSDDEAGNIESEVLLPVTQYMVEIANKNVIVEHRTPRDGEGRLLRSD